VQNTLWITLAQLLPQLPFYLAWLAGMVVALVTWQRHPMVSLLTLIALALFALLALGGTLGFVWVVNQSGGAAERAWLLSAIGLVRAVVGTAAWVLLLVAVFGWRQPPAPRPSPPPFDEEPGEGLPHTGIQKGRSWGDG
jgi:hypothetical protein